MMDMGVNTMIQAMRHMITVMPPKHKGKHLYFNFSKNTFFSLSFSCKFLVCLPQEILQNLTVF